MPQHAQTQHYDLISQLFHWLVVALLIGLITTFYIHDLTPDTSALHLSSIKLHISLGLLIFVVVIARIGWSRLVGKPEPVSQWRILQFAGKAFHVLLNLATLLIPISGFLRVASKDRSAEFFGLFQIPSPIGEVPALNDLMHILHGQPMEILLYCLVGLHVAAALWHQYILRDHALERMLPWARRAA
ncbi:cytochrome b [Allochromatium vinosum]|uniref:Cytochrome B561 n=1 Tax=Allochromatium vinosum (strain ATCC 17899 / DSM 180 / NBRC 103801 / NCIMB 10441 / D) TaxID=572477 RepID=D3RS52_ALLVD|nr:cytochrome b [Allochromatium vinosum]ADC63989.1 cytochrome B561 [Allochromatium vinosum DSM 180]